MNFELDITSVDDPAFLSLVCSFVDHYTDLYRPDRLTVTHVDNWFGERWLGFAGKYLGLAGFRQRRGKLSVDQRDLAIPPFRPSRIVSTHRYQRADDGAYGFQTATYPLHCEKNGGQFRYFWGNGMYVWYSGNTVANSTGSLMLNELNDGGQQAWYIQFDQDPDSIWHFSKCRNIQPTECIQIAQAHYERLKQAAFRRMISNDACNG